MPVLMLSRALRIGAYQRKAELMAEDRRLDLTVVVPERWREEGREVPLERAHLRGYRFVATRLRWPGSFHLHHYPELGALLDQLQPALLHVDEEPYNLATFLAVRAARRRGIGTLFFSWQNLRRRYPPPFSWMERFVHGHADGAIAGSLGAAAALRAKGYQGPLWILPQFGVDADAFRPPTEPDARLNSGRRDPLVIGYAGRLVAAKGVDLLLQAVALSSRPWRLAVVGVGPEEATLRRLAAELGLADRLDLRPWLPSTDMPGFYQGIDVLVLPSRTTPSWKEQFGRVLIEAMASGAVCVGSDSGEIPEVIGDAGLIFPEGDAGALADALRRLEDPVLRARLAQAGRQRVLAQYTMRHVAEETVRIYGAMAGLEDWSAEDGEAPA
ncbi:MAG: glycosyltransferase [Ardenticatenia bacterium]|nr:glycosyltransferase [Ardenticatenia bacterium]